MTDLNKEREADTLPEVAHLLEQCKHRDLTLIERAFVKGARYAWLEKAKAQAVPEGYVLLPRVPTEKMFQAYERYSVAPMSTLSKNGYKAMVEAAGDQNENS
ncbi:hypothetical protein AB720_13025 [Acinetobacter baumannii]|uniref:hypothetical protein n=1 Tax=Acinetobacter baumannii TaxID=470 RepID=UPI000D02865B|nr:hypothetical protein [Acinetobacter baumannii]AVN15104.1 hypothetical protein C6N18_13650 [Acinetobacter baumannii]MCE6553485.1 hypothetical protein [Acinetobacter baumannii]MCE6556640.1 hypothetical protein [Acinetobacter baumannii]MCE6902658.1 hypothetical protein [Acinetobacter baumannii]MCE6910505.1 hypothetical protein [Acinetobacter baumannii]